MARPENPIDYTVPEVGLLSEYLRGVRNESGMTFRELERLTPTSSESTLKRAAKGGRRPPKLDVVIEFVLAAGVGDLDYALELHDKADKAASRASREARRSTVVPKPDLACTRAELGQAMRDAYNAAARPTLDEMVDRAGLALPRSTAHLIRTARSVPNDVRRYLAFLQGCGLQEADLAPWFEAWARVQGLKAGVFDQAVVKRANTKFELFFVRWFRSLIDAYTRSLMEPRRRTDRLEPPKVWVELLGDAGFDGLDVAA
ncbi:hypothetical protein ACFVZD_46100 [Streptomyces sp. NPDC058287]|uniref:hypothetical protein n=1 Tax=Streptomyces sp. NPDC058287 TaxID=3346423 RepID=UPI0036ED20A9